MENKIVNNSIVIIILLLFLHFTLIDEATAVNSTRIKISMYAGRNLKAIIIIAIIVAVYLKYKRREKFPLLNSVIWDEKYSKGFNENISDITTYR